MTTLEINAKLKIVKIEGKKFGTARGYIEMNKGYAFHVEGLGYFAFAADLAPINFLKRAMGRPMIDAPYTPMGGKKALQEILDAGGLLDFDNARWLQEM